MQLLRIDHQTRLKYSAPVVESVAELRMAPPSTDDQTVLGFKLKTTPPTRITTYRDGFGNRVDLWNLAQAHSEVLIQASGCVRVHRRDTKARLAGVPWPAQQPDDVDPLEFLRASQLIRFDDQVKEFTRSIPEPTGELIDGVESLFRAISGRMTYEPKVTDANTSVTEALALGRGVCQDLAHLFIAAARLRGLPSRYVSGYIHSPGELATHAWCQIWPGPGIGWVDIDPTHRVWPAEDHVVTAMGRDFADVPPNRGVWKGEAQETIEVTVSVKVVDRVPADLIELADYQPWTSVGPPQKRRSGQAGPVQQGGDSLVQQQQ